MSEYQYYEFTAIDRPLTRAEMADLSAVSTRATITPTSFVNHYEWGDLKADPAKWMRRYFDAFVYTANWCSCRLALRVPRDVFGEAELKRFATKYAMTIDESADHWIIDWSLDEGEDYDRFGMEDGGGWMGRLVPLRDELLRGDLRPLYLGWLAGAASGEVPETGLEPDVPPGLLQLSGPQQALVEFLEIDPDMLAAAAAGSPSIVAPDMDAGDGIDTWLGGLSCDDMRAPLKQILQGQPHQAERQLKSRFLTWQKQHPQTTASSARQRRSVAELRTLAEAAGGVRLEHQAKERARQEAERRRQREAYLRLLAADFEKCWNAIHLQAERGTASAYDQALRAMVDLAEAYTLTSSRETFDRELRRFLGRHAKRGALVRRLVKAGLWEA